MSLLIDKNERKTLDCLGTHVSSPNIQKNTLYLAYHTTDGLVNTIFLWNSFKNSRFSHISINNPKLIQLSSHDRTEILKTLQNFQHLDSLYFQGFVESAETAELIGKFKNLKKLLIANFKPINLIGSIENLSNLTHLSLSIIQKPFPSPNSLKKLQNLESFHIRTDLKKFPEFILNFKKLTKLSLSYNFLNSIPPSIDSLHNLKEMNFYSNKLSTLPHSIENLPNLTHLNIGKNNFSTIPETIKNLKNLKTIDISYNPFFSLESFKYLFSNPELSITSHFDIADYFKLTIGGLEIPKEVKNYWYERNYEKIIEYYTPPIAEIAQKYAQNPNSLTNHELIRLETEATNKVRDILELSLRDNDPILEMINRKFKIDLNNGLGIMR